MFPGKILLTIEDICQILNISKGHIYNLCSEKRLPFTLIKDKISNKIQVSILEMASHLDKKLEPHKNEVSSEPSVPSLIIKKKGRPRGSVSRLEMQFQHELSMNIMQAETYTVFNELYEKIQSIEFVDDGKSCSEKIDDTKSEFSSYVRDGRDTIFTQFLHLGLSQENKIRKIVKKV